MMMNIKILNFNLNILLAMFKYIYIYIYINKKFTPMASGIVSHVKTKNITGNNSKVISKVVFLLHTALSPSTNKITEERKNAINLGHYSPPQSYISNVPPNKSQS
jgi:hypothetical protein